MQPMPPGNYTSAAHFLASVSALSTVNSYWVARKSHNGTNRTCLLVNGQERFSADFIAGEAYIYLVKPPAVAVEVLCIQA